MVKESELSGDLLATKIRGLLSDRDLLRAMSASAAALAPKNAAALIVETMERYSQPNDALAA
jgi:UDP-N-acetylglucosamine:LPS N-acetylglucosamine transferase